MTSCWRASAGGRASLRPVQGLRGGLLKLRGLGFRVWGLGFRVWSLGFRVWGLGFRAWGLGFTQRLQRSLGSLFF